MEQVSPQLRVLSGSVVASSYAIGESLVGVIAMYTRDWRWFLRYLYMPGVAIVALYWLTPESIRWLVAKGHKEQAKNILRKAAKMNNVHISEDSLNGLDLVEVCIINLKIIIIIISFYNSCQIGLKSRSNLYCIPGVPN